MSCIRRILTALSLGCLIAVLSGPAAGNWERVESNSLAWLHSVYFIDKDKGWVAGSNGTLLTTNDGGRTWNRSPKVTSDNIRDVHFINSQVGWLLCERNQFNLGAKSPSYLLRTTNGGIDWKSFEFTENHDRLTRILFSRSGRGMAVGEGGSAWILSDGEGTWKRISLPTHYLILGGQFVDDLKATLVTAGGTILFDRGNGAGWSESNISAGPRTKLNSAFFVDKELGWVVGAGGRTFCTKDGGNKWTEQAQTTAEDLLDVAFSTDHRGFAVGDNGRIIELNSEGNWDVVEIKVRTRLERIVPVEGRWFAVGYGGTILKYDPDYRS